MWHWQFLIAAMFFAIVGTWAEMKGLEWVSRITNVISSVLATLW